MPVKKKSSKAIAETCIVLAGGMGTRLKSISGGLNKHACLLIGKIALDHVLDPILATPSVSKVVIVIQPNSKSWIRDLLRARKPKKPVSICIQPVPNGTLNAVQCGLPAVETNFFSVHYGDNIFGWTRLPDIGGLEKSQSLAEIYTIAEFDNAHEFGVVEVENVRGRDRAVGLMEKPSDFTNLRSPRIITGFFRFRTEAFRSAAKGVKVSPRGEFELTDAVKQLIKTPPGVAVRTSGVGWVDFGTPANFVRAETILQERKAKPRRPK